MPLNRVVLVGRLTRDPEMKYTPQGVPVTQLGIAVNRVTKNESGDYDVDFFDVVAWRRTAEYASNYLTKGRLVSIDGRLQTRSWVDQASGQKRKAYEIVADNIDGLDRKGDEAGEGSSSYGGDTGSGESAPAARTSEAPAPARAAAPAAAPARNARAAAPPADDDLDEADPFADE